MTDEFIWQTASPQSQGLSLEGLESLRDILAARRTRSLLIVRNDRIVFEWYAPAFAPHRRHYTASLAKSIVGGLALALTLQDGRIGLSDYACDYIHPWQADDKKCKIRVLHLASHGSGMDDAADGQTVHGLLPGWKGLFWKRQPIDPFTIARDEAPLIAEPGTRFRYSNPGSAMLAYAITAALAGSAHPDIRSLLRDRLYAPIGIADTEWEVGYDTTYRVDGLPLVPTWAGAAFMPRATARIGRLLLHNGIWQGRQLLDPEMLRKTTTYAATPLPDRSVQSPWPAPTPGWWSNADSVLTGLPRDTYCGAGSGHQILLVVPSLHLIVVRNGSFLGDFRQGEQFWTGMQNYLFDPLTAAIL